MRYYIIFQSSAFEIEGQKVSKGDIIFNYVGGAIVSVGIVTEKAYPSSKGDELDIEYTILTQKLGVKKIFSKIRELIANEPSPFTCQGRKAKGGLHELNQACGELIMEKIMEDN